MLCDFWVRDKFNGTIHKVGDWQHDSIWVDGEGELHYMNLQNGDGCSGKTHLDEGCGYEFLPSDGGTLDVNKDGSPAWEQDIPQGMMKAGV